MRLLLLVVLMCTYSTVKLTYGEKNCLETSGKECDNGLLKLASSVHNESTNRWNNRRNRRNRKNRNNNYRKINNGFINKSKSNQTLSDGAQQTPLNSKKQTIFYESLKINPKKIVAKMSVNEVHDKVHEESVLSDESEPKVQHKRYTHQSNITTLEVGVYSIAAVFGVAVLILVITCSVFALKLKYKNPPETVTTTITTSSTVDTAKRVATHPHVSNANEWVYLGKATLERNSSKQHTLLLPEKDFNGNFSDNNSICANQANDSNRLSGLSEISIRITSNPTPVKDFDKLSDKVSEDCIFADKHSIKRKLANISLNGPPIPVRNSSRVNKFSTYTKRPSIPPHRHMKGSKINNLNEIDSVFVPKPATHSKRAPPVPPHQKKRNKNDDINSKLYLDNPLRVDMPKNKTIDEWNKTKMDYKQWMHYFENSKESNA